MTSRKRPLTAQEDLAESKRRAKAARTPIAKVVTKQVVEKQERTYSGQAAHEAVAQTRQGVRPAAAGITPTPKRAVPGRKAVPKRR